MGLLNAQLRNKCTMFDNDTFIYHIHHNPLCDKCGVVEDAIHYFFNYRKFTIIERLAFNDTVRVFQPKVLICFFLAIITVILKTILSCSGMPIEIYTLQNAFDKLVSLCLKLILNRIFTYKFQNSINKFYIIYSQAEGVPSGSLIICFSIHFFIFFIHICIYLIILALLFNCHLHMHIFTY